MNKLLIFNHIYSLFAANVLNVAANRVTTSWPWYVIRGAGFAAAGLLFLLMMSGIGQVTGATYRFIEPIKAWAIHKALAIMMCIMIAIHVGFLLLDHFISFSVIQLFLPFASHYNNGTKLAGIPLGGVAISLGILAMYGVAIVVLSSLGWINSRKKQWRKLHYISYAVVFLVFLHAIYVGSDLKYGIFRKSWEVLGFIVVIGIISRLWRAGTTNQSDR
jgi:predicted ferric reductase